MIRLLQRWLGKGRKPLPLARIRESFDCSAADEQHFPSTIDPRIYHVQLIRRFFDGLDGERVLDAGCGKGRFIRALAPQLPSCRFCGMDLSEKMLAGVPGEAWRVSGTLTGLPFASGSFGAVYATESLEHAQDIRGAVAELCRVLRPGGRLAIIDKNAEHWGRLETPEWERWFHRGELERLLRAHCREVRSEPVSYWEDVAPDGLFLAWLARK